MRPGLGVRVPQIYAGAPNSSRWTSMSSQGWGSATSPSGRAWPDLRCMGGSASDSSQVHLALALAARVRSWPAGPPRKTDVRARPRTLGTCPDSTPLGRSRHPQAIPRETRARSLRLGRDGFPAIRLIPNDPLSALPCIWKSHGCCGSPSSGVAILVVKGGTQHPAGPGSIRVRFAPPASSPVATTYPILPTNADSGPQ